MRRLQDGIESATVSSKASMDALAILMLSSTAEARRTAVEVAEKAADEERVKQAEADETIRQQVEAEALSLVEAAEERAAQLVSAAEDEGKRCELERTKRAHASCLV